MIPTIANYHPTEKFIDNIDSVSRSAATVSKLCGCPKSLGAVSTVAMVGIVVAALQLCDGIELAEVELCDYM